MIARVWHGWTDAGRADAYERLLFDSVVAGLERRGIDGYRGASVYRRDVPEGVEFVTTLLFDSLDAVRAFAGADLRAVVPAEARALLSRFDERAAHYEVRHAPGGAAGG